MTSPVGAAWIGTFLGLFESHGGGPPEALWSIEETLVGGQAVMEGVMMRAPHSYCVAVRKHTGEIITEEMPLARMSEQYKIFRYPIFRGLGTLYQALKLGGRALRFSANAALDNPEYQKAAPFAQVVYESVANADITKPTKDPVPYVGIQYVAIPEFQGIGTTVSQQIAAALAGQVTVDQALETAQAAAERTMKQAGYIR